MIINKFISTKSVIEGVYRDTQTTADLPWADLIYWCYEALDLIGAPQQYIPKVTGHKANPNLNISNFRAELPCDFHKLVQMSVNGLPVRYTGNSFHHLLSGECCGFDSNSQIDTFVDSFGNRFSPQNSTMNSTNVYDSVTFDINNNFITFSTKEGQCCIAYLAYPTDEEGFPMVPDEISYKIAVTKYLMFKLSYVDWIKDPDSRGKKAVFDYNEREWMWYVGQASNKVKIPDLEQMESLKNQVIRLIPNINEHDTFFGYLGAKQIKRLK